MENIVVDKRRDVIVIEKSNGNNILEGSKLFCGCCGEQLGELSETITFPFNAADLNKVVINKSYDIMLFGLRHRTCGHSMFSFRKEYGFMTLDNYIKETKPHTMNPSTPERMKSVFSSTSLKTNVLNFEKKLLQEDKGQSYYHIVIRGELDRGMCDEIEKVYLNAGWSRVICKTSSENGELPGLTGLKLYV